MSSYRYRCEQCRTTSPPMPTRREVEVERDRHRALAHAGHIPDGEEIKGPPANEPPGTPLQRAIVTAIVITIFVIATWVRLA
ncbi:hypothetical protein [Streptomyces sp. NPDC056132]|uniref:hypothetical protein n=1 Tax=Streptomyces sp. NPDC056132 TaxID=3345722 RepID=UPI0035D6610A